MAGRQENSSMANQQGTSVSASLPEQYQEQYLIALRILEQVQKDYSLTKNKLDSICHVFGEREAATRKQIRHIMPPTENLLAPGIRAEGHQSQSLRYSTASKPPASLRAHCFGNFEIYLNWEKRDRWLSLKAKSLLKYLVIHRNRPVHRDILMEILWPDCDPEAGGNNLKSAVYALRQMFSKGQTDKIDSPIIVFSEGHYYIDPKLEIWVDIEEFESNWLAGLRLEKSNERLDAITKYQLAYELYRGDYLEDEPYTDWTLLRREALKDTYLAIIAKLINASFKSADYVNCIEYSQRILAKDTCHEEAYRWLMRCYARLGQNHRAQQWYELCATTLKKELNTMPCRQTHSLYQKIINREPI
jgi:DNA-binding SARP family transcriptional activator